MQFLSKINNFSDKFQKLAQVLESGQSTISYQEARNTCTDIKTKIETLLEQNKIDYRYPTNYILKICNQIINRQPIEYTDKEWAKLQFRSLYDHFSELESDNFNRIVDTYHDMKMNF